MKKIVLLWFGLLGLVTLSIAQHNPSEKEKQYGIEKMDDPYLPIPKESKATSPAYRSITTEVITVQVNVDENGENMLNDAANEPSIGVNPANPNQMVIGWRQFDNIASNFRQAGIAYSTDAGNQWIALEPLEAGVFRSDPVLDTDNEGAFYYNSLQDDFTCDVFKSSDLLDWSDKTFAWGGDKQWMVIDKTGSNSDGMIYANWKSSFSACDSYNFTRSFDRGASYESCSFVTNDPTRGSLAVGPQGEVYVAGGSGSSHRVLRSASAQSTGEIDWEINTLVNMKGSQALYDGPNPGGMLGQVWVAANHHPDFANQVYVLSSVDRLDNSDPSDIMFARSEDGGETWSEAIRINDDPETDNWQWFGTMSVAPNGRLDVVWLDTRDQLQEFYSALFYAYSEDGGITWSDNEQLSEAFDPHAGWPNQQKMGDYFHMISMDEGAHLAWCATFTGGQDVYYSFIPAPVINSIDEESLSRFSIAPNPIQDHLQLSFTLTQSDELSISILDLLGSQKAVLLRDRFDAGSYRLDLQVERSLPPGLYLISITNKSGQQFVKNAVIAH